MNSFATTSPKAHTSGLYVRRFAIAVTSLLVGLGCEDKKTSTQTGRSDSISVASAVATIATPLSEQKAHSKEPVQTAPRKLCEKAPLAQGKSLPDLDLGSLYASTDGSPGKRIQTTNASWTWVNLWAAWCGPCKEEIPRLKKFEREASAKGKPFKLFFLSLDDDQRQAQKFLDSQPVGGLKQSFWLTEGALRTNFMDHFKLKSAPELPMHLLFNPAGKLQCVIDGAIEDADANEALRIVSSP